LCLRQCHSVRPLIFLSQPLKNPDLPSKEMCVPWIRMQGRWLQQAGFVINAPVKVRVMHGCVVLTIE